MNHSNDEENKSIDRDVSSEKISDNRRKALSKLGKFAYAAPVITSLLMSRAEALPSIPPPPGGFP